MASSSSIPSSTIALPKKYNVFLSFRGPDTRVGFTGHLNEALSRKYMVTFIDYKLERGDEISPALLKSIQESMIAVVIFSQDYASSKWCLRELAEIMKREKLCELTVIPVFYYVNPTDVRKQTGPFKDSFSEHENKSQDEVQEWRKAFTEASNRSGWDYAGTRPESELVRDIVEDIQRKLMSKYISPPLNDSEGLIGIDKRIERVMKLSCPDTKDVIGIWGMGGIGKTTLAKAVFNRISNQFDGSCFIEDVSKKLENSGSSNGLLLEVLSEVLHDKDLKLGTLTNTISPFIMDRFHRVRALIVLDNINDFFQPETLVKGLMQCGSGSKIIITSRDKQVLYNFKVLDYNIYKVEGLNFDEALMLFSNCAFNQNLPPGDFMDLSVQMVLYAEGNPLALKVLGSHLLRKDKQEWESAFVDLQGIGGSKIFNVLKISYDHLDDKVKGLFLDIACFFNGYYEHDIVKLLDCKYYLGVLVNKSLITIEKGGTKMLDQVQKMGREIVISKSPKNPGKRSRLWKRNDVIRTLKNNNGTEEVEGISLNMDHLQDVYLSLSCRVFDKMPNLRLLLFTCHSLGSNKVHLSDGRLNSLPDDLIILEWHRYPLRELPSNFSPEKLVKLDLSSSDIEQLWEGIKHAPKLKWLILKYCTYLIRIPNLTDFLSLEEVDLTGCYSLVEFPSPVQQLNKLRYLRMGGCSNVEFPSSVQQFNELRDLHMGGCSNVTKFPLTSASIETLNLSWTAIEEVPPSIQSLTNLTELNLSRCTRIKHISASISKLKSLLTLCLSGCSELETFPEISETMEILNSLELSETAITELHSSIGHLNGLQRLTLGNCKNLEMLPSSICDLTSLENLDLFYCSKLVKLPDNLGNLKSLKVLRVRGSAVGQLPSSITCLENLESLDCSECKGLTILPPLSGLCSLSYLSLKECNLMEIPEDIGCLSSLERLDLCGNMFESLPKSIKHLSKLKTLLLKDCNMLRSLTELPVAPRELNAINCKQLCQALPDASEFKRCITSKYHKRCITRFRWRCDQHAKRLCQLCPPHYEYVKFLFINCFNLDQKAVSNVFAESLKGSEEPLTQFSIYLPGNKIPEWFTYQSSGSSINIPVLRQDLINRKLMGFAICAVLGIEEFHKLPDYLAVDIYCHFETCDDHIYFPPSSDTSTGRVSINSDHILLGYSSFSKFLSSSQNLEMLPDSECDYVDIPFEFNYTSEDFEVKYCAVHPIYAKPIKIIGPNIEDIEEISGKRSGRSDDTKEEVEQHSKRFCTQPKLMLPISNQNP